VVSVGLVVAGGTGERGWGVDERGELVAGGPGLAAFVISPGAVSRSRAASEGIEVVVFDDKGEVI
jgi:hypothetical protein